VSREPLTIHELPGEDCWRDIARIPRVHRVDVNGKRIRRAKICKVTIRGKHKLLAVRGSPEPDARILLDSPTRIDFDVDIGTAYDVELRPVGWLGYWRWAWGAADPAYRVPAQISLISFFLGLLALVLGILGSWEGFLHAWQKILSK
jgi:hypothetical protein